MKVFAKTLRVLSVVNVVGCLVLLVVYLFSSEQFTTDQALGAVADLVCFEAFFLTLLLGAVFAANYGIKGQARLYKISIAQRCVYILSRAFPVYLLLKVLVLDPDFSTAQATLPVFLTLSVILNNRTDITVSSWLFHRSPTDYSPGVFDAWNGDTPECVLKEYADYLSERVTYLKTFSRIDLDYSEKSLLPLWKWFRRQCKVDFFSCEPLGESVRFTAETDSILHDISLYFAEVCIRNDATIFWSVSADTKSMSLSGFPNGQILHPSQSVRKVANYILKEVDKPRDLLDLYTSRKRHP